MTALDLLGGIGLLLIMAAFVGTLRKWIGQTDTITLLMNGIGAGILSLYSAAIGVWIFVILEGAWSVVAFGTMALSPRRHAREAIDGHTSKRSTH